MTTPYDESTLVPLVSNHLVDDGNGRSTAVTPTGDPFVPTPEWMSQFQDSEGNWREDWPMIQAISICHTEGCSQYGIQLEITLAVNVDGVFRNMCGGCNQAPDLYELPLQ